jgi:hypothetical protein
LVFLEGVTLKKPCFFQVKTNISPQGDPQDDPRISRGDPCQLEEIRTMELSMVRTPEGDPQVSFLSKIRFSSRRYAIFTFTTVVFS